MSEPQNRPPLHDPGVVAKAITDYAEHLTRIPPALKARAVNAVGPALQAQGEWLRLSARQAVAAAVLTALMGELDSLPSGMDVAGACPACGGSSLFLGEGGHVTCSRLDCPNPCAADELLHGEPSGTAATHVTEQEETTRVFAALHRSTEQDVTRVIDLYERWVQAGPPPLGTSINRWWDRRLVELHNAIRPGAATDAP